MHHNFSSSAASTLTLCELYKTFFTQRPQFQSGQQTNAMIEIQEKSRSQIAAQMEAAMASGSQSFCDVFAASSGSNSNSIPGRKVNVLPRVRGVSEKQREVPDAIEDARSVIQEASATIGPPTAIDAEIHPILPASSSLSWHTFVKNSATNSPWHGQEEGCVNKDDDSATNGEDDDGVAEEDAQGGDAELHEEDIDNEDPTVKVDVFVRYRSEMSQKVQDEDDVHVLPSPEPSEVASVGSSGENNGTVKENYDHAESVDGVDNKEVPNHEDTSNDEPQAHVEDALKADLRRSSSDKEPSSATTSATKKGFGIAGMLKRKARMNDTRKGSTTVEGIATPAVTSIKDNGLLKLRRRVRMLGGSKKSSKKKMGGGGKKKKAIREDRMPLSPIKESTGEEPKSSPIMATIEKNETVSTVPSTPVKKKASTGSGGALATIIVTPFHQVVVGNKTESDDTPTTTTSVSSLELSPSPIQNGADSPACTLEMPRTPPAMPAAESASASGGSSSSDSSSSASSSNCSSTDDEASSAKDSSCNMAFPRVSTFLSQEGQEAPSIFTIPNPQTAMCTFAEGGEEEETDITEEVLVQAMNYYANSEKLQVLLEQKAAEEQVAVREMEKLVQEEDDGSHDTEVEDADTVVDEGYNEEVDGEDVSVHVIYDDEQHGVIGSSKDVLVEVSSTAEGHAGDIEVIKCMGLEDIGLEVAATRDYETTNHDVDPANNEEADEEEDSHQVEQDSIKQNSRSTKQSDKTKKSTTTANTEGTSKTGTSSSTGRKSLASRLSRGRVREAANNSKSSHNENGRSKSRTKGRGRSKSVPRKGRFSLKKKTSSVSDNDDTVSRKGLSSEAKKAVDDADSAHQPADEIILTAVETPVLGSDNRYGLSEEAREALACDYEPKGIKPNKNTPGLSQNARYALAVEQEAEEEWEDDLEEIEVDVRASRNPRGKRSERITVSRKIRHSRSTQSYEDESTIGGESLAYASYASGYETVDEESTFYEEESYDDASRSFVSYDDRSGYETKEENFVFGIPQDELIEDLKEAFADTTAHIQNMITASLNITESIVLDQMINNGDSERERTKRREASIRRSAAVPGDRRRSRKQSHPESRHSSNRDERERRSKRSDAERRKSKQTSRLRVEV